MVVELQSRNHRIAIAARQRRCQIVPIHQLYRTLKGEFRAKRERQIDGQSFRMSRCVGIAERGKIRIRKKSDAPALVLWRLCVEIDLPDKEWRADAWVRSWEPGSLKPLPKRTLQTLRNARAPVAGASEHSRILGIFGHRRRAFRSVGDVECRTARRGLEGGLVCCQKTGPGPRATSSVRWLLRRCCTTLGSITSKHIYYTKAYYLTAQELRFDGVHPRSASEWGLSLSEQQDPCS